MSVDLNMHAAIVDMGERARDASGFITPGYQPKFSDSLSTRDQKIDIPDPLSVVAPESTY